MPTHLNPADLATPALPAEQLSSSTWLREPIFLRDSNHSEIGTCRFDLVNPETDVELLPEVTTCVTSLSKGKLGRAKFDKFSSWSVLLWAVCWILAIALLFKSSPGSKCYGWHKCGERLNENQLNQSQTTVIRIVQGEIYAEEMKRVEHGMSVSQVLSVNWTPLLTPMVFSESVGAWRAQLTSDVINPILVSGKHHQAELMIRHFHHKVHHQGRHFTEGAITARAISTVIFNCVTCRRLRGKRRGQFMTDLPKDRLSTDPPFTRVGLDVFGPWPVSDTRWPSRCQKVGSHIHMYE